MEEHVGESLYDIGVGTDNNQMAKGNFIKGGKKKSGFIKILNVCDNS